MHGRHLRQRRGGAGEACDCGTDPTKLPERLHRPERSLQRRRHRLLQDLHQGAGLPERRPERRRPARRAAETATSRRARTATTATLINGDGCSSTCKLEAGFTCMTAPKSDAAACMQTASTRARTASSCRSSTATSRTRASPAATPTSSITGAADPQPDHGHLDHAREHLVQAALLRPQLGRPRAEERLDGPLLGSRAGEPGRERPAGLQQHAHGRHDLRLPVHRLEPQRRQQQHRPRLRRCDHRAAPAERAGVRQLGQCPRLPLVPRAGAGRDQRDDRSGSGGPTVRTRATGDGRQTRHRHPRARPGHGRRQRTTIGSPARRTACGAASTRSIRRPTISRSTRRPAAPAGRGR